MPPLGVIYMKQDTDLEVMVQSIYQCNKIEKANGLIIMYDLNVMSFSITNGVRFFFCFIFKISAWDSMGSMIFVWGTSAGTSVATMPFSASKTRTSGWRICFKISQVLKLFSAISFHLQGWFFCWTTDQPPQKSRTCAAATIFLELESQRSQMASFGDLWLCQQGKLLKG